MTPIKTVFISSSGMFNVRLIASNVDLFAPEGVAVLKSARPHGEENALEVAVITDPRTSIPFQIAHIFKELEITDPTRAADRSSEVINGEVQSLVKKYVKLIDLYVENADKVHIFKEADVSKAIAFVAEKLGVAEYNEIALADIPVPADKNLFYDLVGTPLYEEISRVINAPDLAPAIEAYEKVLPLAN